jgi:uncharacterized Rmd1/YagE family protein
MTKNIIITVLGNELIQEQIETVLISKLNAKQYRDAYCITFDHGECWLFDYAVLVAWGVSEVDRQQLYEVLTPLIDTPISLPLKEKYLWSVDEGTPLRIHHDNLYLTSHDPMIRLALSHAFAQSGKLIFFEDQAQEVIKHNAYISREIAKTGKIPLSRRQLAKLRGSIFETSTDISLHYGLLDTPEFFWDYPELEETYQKLAKYLDLQPRIEILNKKLATIQSLLDMLAGEQNHKHSAFLEWIIIVLIAVDITVYFV